MPPYIEPLHRGLVDKPDPSTLQPGELTRTRDCYYPPDERTLRRYPGRSLEIDLTTLPTPTIDDVPLDSAALHHITFDDIADPVFLARGSSSIWAWPKSDPKKIQLLTTTPPQGFVAAGEEVFKIGDAPTIEQYANEFFLFDGVNPGQVIRDSLTKSLNDNTTPTLDRLGMTDAVTPPSVEVLTEADVWGDFHDTGRFWYLTTEYDIDTDLESGTTAEPLNGQVNDTTDTSIRVRRPAIINERATHWIVYRAKADSTPGLNLFNRVAVMDAASTEFVDDDGTGSVPADSYSATGLGTAVINATSWFNAGLAVDGDTNTFASTTSTGTESAFEVDNIWSSAEITNIEAGIPVSGIKLVLHMGGTEASSGAAAAAIVEISPDGGGTWLRSRPRGDGALQEVTSNNRDYEFGDDLTPWYTKEDTGLGGLVFERYNWAAGDFDDGQFRIRIRNAWQGSTLRIHEITSLTVYTNGQSVDSRPIGEPFPTVEISIPGTSFTSVSPGVGPPPVASTATIFEASLVCNDVADPSRIVWSQSDTVEVFPPAYFFNIETPDRDEVTCVQSTQDWLFVGLNRHIYRMNYLPTEQDLLFDRGRAGSIVDGQHGVVGPRAAVTLNLDNAATMVAFIDRYHGLVACDGHRIYHLTEGLDWESKVNPDHLKRCILMNYAPWQALILYYVPRGGSKLTRAMVFSYEAAHRRAATTLTVTGPIRLPDTVAATLAREGPEVAMYLLDDALKVWREDEGTDAAGVLMQMDVRTREIYFAGIGQEVRAERLYARYRDISGCQLRATERFTEAGGEVRPPVSRTYDRAIAEPDEGHIRFEVDATTEAVTLELAAIPDTGREDDYTLGLDYVGWEVTGYGRQD